jgi:cytochrome c1
VAIEIKWTCPVCKKENVDNFENVEHPLCECGETFSWADVITPDEFQAADDQLGIVLNSQYKRDYHGI